MRSQPYSLSPDIRRINKGKRKTIGVELVMELGFDDSRIRVALHAPLQDIGGRCREEIPKDRKQEHEERDISNGPFHFVSLLYSFSTL